MATAWVVGPGDLVTFRGIATATEVRASGSSSLSDAGQAGVQA